MLFQKGHALNKGRIPWNKGKKGISRGGRKKEGKDVICVGCGISFYKKLSRIVKYNFHNSECFRNYREKNIRYPWSIEVYLKNLGSNSHAWKDIMVSESALHKWVNYHKGPPEYCIDCGTSKFERELEWSNQSGLYFRDLNDFIGRCQRCHKKHDKKLGYARKKSFDDKGNRIGIPFVIPEEYLTH